MITGGDFMSKNEKDIAAELLITDGSGNYNGYNMLSEEKKREHHRQVIKEWSRFFSELYSRDPELLREHIRKGIVTDSDTQNSS